MQIKSNKISFRLLYYLFLIVIILELILISHRTTFSINNFISFTKEGSGLYEGLKDKKIFIIFLFKNLFTVKNINIVYFINFFTLQVLAIIRS